MRSIDPLIVTKWLQISGVKKVTKVLQFGVKKVTIQLQNDFTTRCGRKRAAKKKTPSVVHTEGVFDSSCRPLSRVMGLRS